MGRGEGEVKACENTFAPIRLISSNKFKPPRTRIAGNPEKDAKEPQDTPMIDAGCDPIEPRQLQNETDDHRKGPVRRQKIVL